MWRYADFLRVRQDFADVYSQEEDAKRPQAWRYFMPHKAFRELLQSFLSSGLREGNVKPVWIFGPYGTGKTYACFVLKHLLEDDWQEVEGYLGRDPLLKNLVPDFKALRDRGPWIVAYRSAASFVTSSKVLLSSVQESIKEVLAKRGFSPPLTHKEKVCQYLEEHPHLFTDLFERHRYDTFASFAAQEDVLSYLQGPSSPEAVTLLEKICALLEEENVILHATPDDLKEWLKQVITENNLGGILFIWDEFTDFFRTSAPVSDFQELAHAATDITFYFLPVTHVTPEIVRRKAALEENTAKKLFDRFKLVRFELQPVTAYELAAGAIEVLSEKEEEWEEQKDLLWLDLGEIAGKLVADEEGVNIEHLKRLLPLHPYTAYLLAEIARRHSSSQRSLFKFIKDDETGFSWFIKNCPQDEDGPYWLLADRLWDYFFSEGPPEEFPDQIRSLVSFVLARLKNIPDPEAQTVFKIIMLQRLLHDLNPSPLLIPDRKNLKFALTKEIYGRLEEHVRFLKEGGFINVSPKGAGNEEYLLPLGYSPDEIRKILDELKKEWPFSRFVTEELQPALGDRFQIDGFLEPRFSLKVFSLRDFSSRLRYLEEKSEPYEIPVVAMVVSSEDEHLKAVETARRTASQLERTVLVVLQPSFEEEEFVRWLEHKAKERFAKEKGDTRNEQYHQREAEAVIREWLERTGYRDFLVLWKGREEELRWISFKDFYREVSGKIFPCGPEKICQNPETLYQRSSFSQLKEPLEVGLKLRKPSKRYEEFCEHLERQARVKGTPVSEALSRTQKAIENGRLNLRTLWQEFSKAPFGFHPSPAGKTFFAFVLKDFAKPDFYLYDGVRSTPLSPQGMRDALEKLFRNKIGPEGLYICASSPETEELINNLKKAFRLDEEGALYLESLRNEIRDQIKKLGYPLFSFKYIFDELPIPKDDLFLRATSFIEEQKQAWSKFLDLIGIWLASEKQVSDIKPRTDLSRSDILSMHLDDPKEALEIVYLLNKEYLFCSRLRKIFLTTKAEEGFNRFVICKYPLLKELLVKEDLKINTLIVHLQNLLPEELFCWDEETIEKLLPEIWQELKIFKALKFITSYYDIESFKEILDKFTKNYLKERVKLNLFFLAREQDNEIRFVLENLARLAREEKLSKKEKERLAELLEKYAKNVRNIFSQITSFFVDWVTKKTRQKISENEAYEILEELAPFVLDEDISKIERLIQEKCAQLDRLKLYRFMKKRWEELTNSKSPKEWSEKRLVPIHWLFEGKEFRELFDVLNLSSATSVPLGTIEKMSSFLEENSEQIARIKEKEAERYLLKRLLNLEDKVSFLGKNFIWDLKHELINKSKLSVEEWPYHEDRLRKIAKEFLKERYSSTIKKILKENLEKIPLEKSKELILSLIDDPEIGLKVLERLT